MPLGRALPMLVLGHVLLISAAVQPAPMDTRHLLGEGAFAQRVSAGAGATFP
jgi:hypothetical protein